MQMLQAFAQKDLAEQVNLLQTIESEKPVDAIPVLCELCEAHAEDPTIGYMIKNTLRVLFSANESETVSAIQSSLPSVTKIAVEIAGQRKFASAVPILGDLVQHATENSSLFQYLSALSGMRDAETAGLFRQHITHADPLISALCAEMMGIFKDEGSTRALCAIIEAGETDDNYETCDIPEVNAIKALGEIGNEVSISYLVSKIHHRNPTARFLVHEELKQLGEPVLPFLKAIFDETDVDRKIMAANVCQMIASKAAGDLLVNAIDKGAAEHPNIRFAVYEAFGDIPSMKSLVCLVDALSEKEAPLLLAVVASLDKQVNPGVLQNIKRRIESDADHGARLIKAIVATHALNIFEAFYTGEPDLARQIIAQVKATREAEVLEAFKQRLGSMDAPGAGDDAAQLMDTLAHARPAGERTKLLAVDDSKGMLFFYRSFASDFDYGLSTAENGRQALALLEKGESFDLIITDMNMPEMDGIEFTRKVRENMFFSDTPIIMATTESDSSQVQLAQNAGVSSFIQKPFKPEVLNEKVKQGLA